MDLEKRARFNTLRLKWILDPETDAAEWQVEDLRALRVETLFERLQALGIEITPEEFLEAVSETESPEELEGLLSLEAGLEEGELQDKTYLIIFELWRRLAPESPTLSIICDEIDHLIHLYDSEQLESVEELHEILMRLHAILEESIDDSFNPKGAFKAISLGLANDLEEFLYDFIAEQIETGDIKLAQEILEASEEFIDDHKWFDYLKARIAAFDDPDLAGALVKVLTHEALEASDLEFNLELLTFLAQEGDPHLFRMLVKETLPHLKTEEDFQDLLAIAADFCRFLDQDEKERMISGILKERIKLSQEGPIREKDPDLVKLCDILS